eukprot:jgi/Astpho2/5856/Aster-02362
MRHGRSQMNDFLAEHPYKSPGFEDPLLYDTRLTQYGAQQAEAARPDAEKLNPKPQVLILSPLTRALQTAELAFAGSDVGRTSGELAQEFDHDFSELEGLWWYNEGSQDAKHIAEEPMDRFQQRMQAFKKYLKLRPENVLGVVAHHGVLHELTGKDFSNCEIWSCYLDELL